MWTKACLKEYTYYIFSLNIFKCCFEYTEPAVRTYFLCHVQAIVLYTGFARKECLIGRFWLLFVWADWEQLSLHIFSILFVKIDPWGSDPISAINPIQCWISPPPHTPPPPHHNPPLPHHPPSHHPDISFFGIPCNSRAVTCNFYMLHAIGNVTCLLFTSRCCMVTWKIHGNWICYW